MPTGTNPEDVVLPDTPDEDVPSTAPEEQTDEEVAAVRALDEDPEDESRLTEEVN
jgi:hypothetical protein